MPEDLIGVGDHHVVVVLRMSGRGRGSGVPVEETIAHLWTLRDGKAVELQVYSDPEDALRDARAGREPAIDVRCGHGRADRRLRSDRVHRPA